MRSRIALGTAQFGLGYGLANRSGQLTPSEATAVLAHARDAGVDTLDTAIAYGDSERRLGEIGVDGWRVITKLPALPPDCGDVMGWVRSSVEGSLARLRIPQLHGVLLHRPAELRGRSGDTLYRALRALTEEGLAGKIGISVYGPDELEDIIPDHPADLVQAPFNVLDQRLLTSGWLHRLKGAGVELHVRSVFLQGVLLMDPGARPAYFDAWEPVWRRWDQWRGEQHVSALHACLAFALAQPQIDRVVVGVDGSAQLKEILAASDERPLAVPTELGSQDPALLNPSQWTIS